MPNMNEEYRNEIADHGATLIDYIALVDDEGDELDDSGRYERQPVTWTTATDGTIRPDDDITFEIDGGQTVGGWRGYDEASGGTDYGGKDLPTESFDNDGEYRLIAEDTGILHQSPA